MFQLLLQLFKPNYVQLSCGKYKTLKEEERSNADDVLNDMVDKLLKREDADKWFMEFEERRLKLEEQTEERSREQEHNKQMQIMFLQLMQQAMQKNSYRRNANVKIRMYFSCSESLH